MRDLKSINARHKMTVLAAVLGIALLTENPYVLGFLLTTAICAGVPAGISFSGFLRGLIAVAPFMLTQLIFGKGSGEGGFLPLIISCLRVALMVLAALVLTNTTKSDELMDALLWWMKPLRRVGVDTERIGSILSIGIHYGPAIAEEGCAILKDGFVGRKIPLRAVPGELAALMEKMVLMSLREIKDVRHQ